VRDVRADALEDPAVAAVLAQEHDRREARGHDDDRRDEERERLPDVEERPAADQCGSERGAPHEVLRALRPAEHPLREQVGVEAAVGRLVHVVGEKGEDEQRRRPQARHERHQREAEADGAERNEHERPPPPERRVERVAPGPDHERERHGEETLGREHKRDQRRRRRELAEQRRQVCRGGCEREGEPERPEAERPDDSRVTRLRPELR
jgi:hypothetical protein